MTDKPTPTDAEIIAVAATEGVRVRTGAVAIKFAHAVLAKWGQPAQAAEPVAWLDPWTGTKVTTDYDAYGKHGIALDTAPQPSPAAQGDVLESEYQRGYRQGYEQRDAEVRGALV